MEKITGSVVRQFLEAEGEKLRITNGDHYYSVRERFNEHEEPLDFLFLNRACFNGMMRFNRKGGFNVPFCRKPERFSKALITKIVNQVEQARNVIQSGDYKFYNVDFREAVTLANSEDLVYCDPPYIGRHVDYYDSWNEDQERDLQRMLANSGSKYVLPTWLRNKYRANPFAQLLLGDCYVAEKEHFYHLGAREENRNAITEAVLCIFAVPGLSRLRHRRFEGPKAKEAMRRAAAESRI